MTRPTHWDSIGPNARIHPGTVEGCAACSPEENPMTERPYDFNAGDVRFLEGSHPDARAAAEEEAHLREIERGRPQTVRPTHGPLAGDKRKFWLVQDAIA